MGLLGSFRLGKGLISRMLLVGFKVDSESVCVGVGLICARCAARFFSSFWAASGMCASSGLLLPERSKGSQPTS